MTVALDRNAERNATEGITLLQAVSEALQEEMARDPRVVLLGQDIGRKGGVFKVTVGLQAEFGALRVLDTPIAEDVIAGTAIGAAMMGLRPIAEFQFADYIFPALDQIVSQAATIRWRSVGGFGVPAVFRAPFGAGVRGGVYHSQSVEAYFCHAPGLKVVAPATPRDAKGLLKSAIRDDDPVVFFEHKKSYRRYREIVPPDELIPIGVARLDREGKDLSIVTYGVGVHHAREAAEILAADGIEVEILDLRTLVPMDHAAIARTVQKTRKALILHEANKTMGIGAEIAAFIGEELFMELDGPIVRVAGDDCHLPYNGPEEDAIIPNPAKWWPPPAAWPRSEPLDEREPAAHRVAGDGSTMAWVMVIVGLALDLIGTIWILQGLNILPGSFMTGQPFWAGAGMVSMIAGLALLLLGIRRKAADG